MSLENPIANNAPEPNAHSESTKERDATKDEVSHVPTHVKSNPTEHWWDKVKPFVEIAGIILLGIYTGYTIKLYRANRDAADAATTAANAAKTEAELTKWHIEDADEAIVEARIDYNEQDKFWSIQILNTGKVSAKDLTVTIDVCLTELPSNESIRTLETYKDSRDELRVAPEVINEMFKSTLTDRELTAVQNGEMGVRLSGTINYDNGFGTTKHKKPCLVYVSEHVPQCNALAAFVADLKRQKHKQ